MKHTNIHPIFTDIFKSFNMPQNIYEVPESVKELFENGEQSYRIINHDKEMDNNHSMAHFIECIGATDENINCDSGTQVILQHKDYEYMLVVDAGGLGDFFSHGFDVSKHIT